MGLFLTVVIAFLVGMFIRAIVISRDILRESA